MALKQHRLQSYAGNQNQLTPQVDPVRGAKTLFNILKIAGYTY